MMDQLIWEVYNFDQNKQKIVKYNILANRIDFIKKLKKICATKEELAENLKIDLRLQYWSRAEYELIIKLTDDERVILLPWCGCLSPEDVAIDVTDAEVFNWIGFAKEHINKQIFKDRAKIDIWDQVEQSFDELVNYCWYTRLPYERDNPKFHKREEKQNV